MEQTTIPIHLILSCCVFGFVYAYYMFNFDLATEIYGKATSPSLLFKQANEATAALILFAYPPLATKKWFRSAAPWLVLAAAVLCSSSLVFAAVTSSQSLMLALAGGCLAGAAFALPFSQWIVSWGKLPFPWLMLIMGLGSVIIGMLCCVLDLLSLRISPLLAMLLPAVAGYLLIRERPWSASASGVEEKAQDDSLQAGGRLSVVRLASFLLCGGFVWALIINTWMPALDVKWFWFFIPCGLVTCAVSALAIRKHAWFGDAYLLLIGIFCVVVLLSLTPLLHSVFGYFSIFTSSWILLFCSIIGIILLSSELGDSASAFTFGSVACIYLAHFVVETVAPRLPLQDTNILVICIVLLVFALILFMGERTDSNSSVGNVEGNAANEPESANPIKALASSYSLTSREEEVMDLLSKGNSVKRISEILVVSENTVKFHRSNIYKKLGINSKQELIDMVSKNSQDA